MVSIIYLYFDIKGRVHEFKAVDTFKEAETATHPKQVIQILATFKLL